MLLTRFISFKEYFDLRKNEIIPAAKWGKLIKEDSESSFSRQTKVIFAFGSNENSFPGYYRSNFLRITFDADVIGQGVATYASFDQDSLETEDRYLLDKYPEYYIDSYALEAVKKVEPPKFFTYQKTALRELLNDFCYILWDDYGLLTNHPESICTDSYSLTPHPEAELISKIYNEIFLVC
jgi:hypothetical protein